MNKKWEVCDLRHSETHNCSVDVQYPKGISAY